MKASAGSVFFMSAGLSVMRRNALCTDLLLRQSGLRCRTISRLTLTCLAGNASNDSIACGVTSVTVACSVAKTTRLNFE